MVFKMMFLNFLSFCSKKELYRATIYSCYNEYKACFYNVKNQHGDVNPYMDSHEWDKLTYDAKTCLRENARKQDELVNEMVELLKVYCKKYPEEKICNYTHLKTYDEYPYRLQQNIPTFIKLL